MVGGYAFKGSQLLDAVGPKSVNALKSDSPVRFADPMGLGRWACGRPISRCPCGAGELVSQIGDGGLLPDYGLRDCGGMPPVERVCQVLHFR